MGVWGSFRANSGYRGLRIPWFLFVCFALAFSGGRGDVSVGGSNLQDLKHTGLRDV